MPNTLVVTLVHYVEEIAASTSFPEVINPHGHRLIDEFSAVVAVTDDRAPMLMDGATFDLAKIDDISSGSTGHRRQDQSRDRDH